MEQEAMRLGCWAMMLVMVVVSSQEERERVSMVRGARRARSPGSFQILLRKQTRRHHSKTICNRIFRRCNTRTKTKQSNDNTV